jgi:hypothetical protein
MNCELCGKSFEEKGGCTSTKLVFLLGSNNLGHRETYERVPYGSETLYLNWDFSIPCHDCWVNVGEFHHPGCDVEECPKCHGQFLGGGVCACFLEGKLEMIA